MASGSAPAQVTVFDILGAGFFVDLVDDFYDRVSRDDLLMAVYPEDLREPRRTTAGFLAQYWGGPPDYSAERGHPRLRMRHAPFVIRQAERDAWLSHMLGALGDTLTQFQSASEYRDEPEFPEVVSQIHQQMIQYFETGSTAMINA